MEARSDKIRVMKPDQKVCTKGRPDDSFLVSYITVSLPSLLNYAYIHIRFLLYSIHQEGPFFHFLVNRSALPSLPSPFTLTARNIVPTLLCLPGTREMKPNIRITMRRKKNKKSKGRIAPPVYLSLFIQVITISASRVFILIRNRALSFHCLLPIPFLKR